MKKVLSALLAIVLVVSSLSIAAYAAPYKDVVGQEFDSLDKPIFTKEQYATMALDMVDLMLIDMNQQLNLDLGGILVIDLDLRSIDRLVTSLKVLIPVITGIAGGSMGYALLGDLSSLGGALENLRQNIPLRTSGDSADIYIVMSLLELLGDISWVVGDLLAGTLNLGMIGNFFDISDLLDLPGMLKGLVADLLFPNRDENFDVKSLTLDQYLANFINSLLDGTYDADEGSTFETIKDFIAENLPGIANEIDLLNDSIYDLLEKALRYALQAPVLIDLVNGQLKRWVGELCGLKYTKDENTGEYIVDDSGKNSNADFVNVDYEFTVQMFADEISTWGDIKTDSFVNHFNDILGLIMEEIATAELDVNWVFGTNDELIGNIIDVAKKLLGKTGGQFFADFVEIVTPGQLDEMTDEEFMAYLLRTIINSLVYDVFVPNDRESIADAVYFIIRSVAAKIVPSMQYNDFPSTDTAEAVDEILSILVDMLLTVLTQVIPLNPVDDEVFYFGMGLHDFLDKFMTWVQENYGGIISYFPGGDAFEVLSGILFNFIPANWLPVNPETASEWTNLFDIIRDEVMVKLFDLDLSGILALLQRNDSGELNGNLITILLARIKSIIDFVFGQTFPTGYPYDNLEMIINPAFLGELITNLLVSLYDRASDNLLDALLPILCMILGLTDGQYFGYPFISLPDTFAFTSGSDNLNTFYMFNGSGGVNTAHTDIYGNQTADKLYTYQIISADAYLDGATVSGVSVTPSTNNIPGGASSTFTIKGLTAGNAANKTLRVTITYNLLGQDGTAITSQSLVQNCFAFLTSGIGSDRGSDVSVMANITDDNTHYLMRAQGIFLNQDARLSSLENFKIEVWRRTGQGSLSSHTINATVSLTASTAPGIPGVSINPLDPIQTEGKGGTWTYNPYKVAEGALLPAANTQPFTSTIQLQASSTRAGGPSENLYYTYYIWVYNDYGLPKLLNDALNSNRQKSAYESGDYTWEYEVDYGFGPEPESETVNGDTVWANYIKAIEDAVAIVYRPKPDQAFNTTHGSKYKAAAEALAKYVDQLKQGIKEDAGGVTAVANALAVYYNPPVGNGDLPYNDPNKFYFTDEDYVTYTYNNFSPERSAAESMIKKDAEGTIVGAIEAAYMKHRVDLYGGRLKRLRAYTEHLAEELDISNQINNDNYTATSWSNFVEARTFASQVNGESIGSAVQDPYKDVWYLTDGGLRQSKVNTARSVLINARKQLKYDTGETLNPRLVAVEDMIANMEDGFMSNRSVEIMYANEIPFGNKDCSEWWGDMMPNNFIYGLDDFNGAYVDGLIEAIDGTYELDYQYNDVGAQSNGTSVLLKDLEGNVVERYWISYFGDLDGDGLAGQDDVAAFVNAMEYAYTWTWDMDVYANPFALAADLNRDGALTPDDAAILISHVFWYGTIKQNSLDPNNYMQQW
ncbi:MAG: hypothetical protein FWF05_02595 [Oscillospiraceae bacterium]|nr:hypothetical protein [Oscillospiraceae bacterium]